MWRILPFWKRTPYAEIFEIIFLKFSSQHRSTLLCSNIVKYVRREIGEIVRYLPDQKTTKIRLPLKLLLMRVSRGAHRICQDQPQQCSQSAPDFIQIVSLSAELGPYSRTREQIAPYRVNPIFGRSLTLSWIIKTRWAKKICSVSSPRKPRALPIFVLSMINIRVTWLHL